MQVKVVRRPSFITVMIYAYRVGEQKIEKSDFFKH